MGSSSWSANDWNNYSTNTQTKSRQTIFSQSSCHKDMNPYGVLTRESRDSNVNPQSNAIIVALDVTASMGHIPEKMVKENLGVMVSEILDRKPVSDPQVMFMAVGDAYCDYAPLQVGQFESDITMTDWLEKIYLEMGGGGNEGESYVLPWYFAGIHTAIDCFEKRKKKGYLFTIGDENFHPILTKEQINEFCGDDVERDMTAKELLTLAERTYDVYHLMVTESMSCNTDVQKSWKSLLGERAIVVKDNTCISEVIVSILQVNSGVDVDSVVNSWSGNTSLVVADAIKNLSKTNNSGGIVRL